MTLPMPDTIAIFEVDPRTHARGGTGPALYKEWIVSPKVGGAGIFAAGLRGNAHTSLILHGHGNGCTEPETSATQRSSEGAERGLHLHRRAGALVLPKTPAGVVSPTTGPTGRTP